MPEENTKTPLQELRQELSKRLPLLPDYKIIELCQDYGINYEMADVNTLRIYMLLCAAEDMILKDLTP